jgi:uncharacterized protein (DUF1330 family)
MESSPARSQPVVIVVLIHLNPGQESQYRAYEHQANAILTEYGGIIDQTITPYATAGAVATPDEVQIVTFPDQAALAAYQSDPRMMTLRSRRDSAVASAIMILGRPTSLTGA